MSFSGFVFDMIGRSKANREMLTLRREQRKELLRKICETGDVHPDLNITLAEFERIQKQTKEKERKDKSIRFRNTCLFLISLIAVFFLLLAVIKLLL